MDKRDFIAISGYKHLIYVITEKKTKALYYGDDCNDDFMTYTYSLVNAVTSITLLFFYSFQLY